MLGDSKPDLLVGIDLGQTCTGVAYNALSQGTDNIRWIQEWPGRAQANENKVPTILVYPHDHDRPSSWGFKAESQAEQSIYHGVVREWFKIYLDQAVFEEYKTRDPGDKATHEDVRHWFRDYLSLLYDHIKLKMSAQLVDSQWRNAKIEFLFSCPTTWSPTIVEKFKEIVGQAGFGGPLNSSHAVTISLTEPEAAAVYTSTAAPGTFKPNDILVVCDAGGGTTDLSALRVTDTAIGALSLKQLSQVDVVKGQNIGSAAIDYDFQELSKSRLREAQRFMPMGVDIDEAAWEMSKGKDYQNSKCEYGSSDGTPSFSVAIPRLGLDYTNPEAKIEHGEITFNQGDLRTLFDKQLDKLFALIDNQLASLQLKFPQEEVNHLVLSGGLGRSAYVQQMLRARYGDGSSPYSNARSMQVRVAPDPQLAVCKGLVADRQRKLKAGEGVMGWRCCRASYGLICRELYDSSNIKHIGRATEKDSRDGKQYVNDCVDWFVIQGQPVSVDKPISHPFRRKIAPGDPRRVFPTKIVVSYNPPQTLPHEVGPGVEKLCEVESDLSGADETKFKERNKKFWQLGTRYYEVRYDIKVIIGPADLRFELWFNDQKMSKDTPIKVEWAPSTAPSTAVLEVPPTPLLNTEGEKVQKKKSRNLLRTQSTDFLRTNFGKSP